MKERRRRLYPKSTVLRPETMGDKLAALQLCERLALMLELVATPHVEALEALGAHQLGFMVRRG